MLLSRNLLSFGKRNFQTMCAMVSSSKRDCESFPDDTLKEQDDLYEKLQKSDSKSLLKKCLTPEIYQKLKDKKTKTGSTLMDCIRSGLLNHDSGIGVYAPDMDAYTTFEDLFDPIIEVYHGGFKKTDSHPAKDWGDVNQFENIDPENKYVISTRVRTGRSIEGCPFNPTMTEKHYKRIEEEVSSILTKLEGDLKGVYYPLTGMDKDTQQKLIDDHYLFKEGDRFLEAANSNRYWPTGRGIFLNEDKTFLVWINEEDHLRIISMQPGGDLKTIYDRLIRGVNELEKTLKFAHHPRLGFLTFCPSNLGSAIRASVHIKLPNLGKHKEELDKIANEYKLQVRGTRGEHTEAEGGVYDVSNKWRLGITEFEAVKFLQDGIKQLIELEQKS